MVWKKFKNASILYAFEKKLEKRKIKEIELKKGNYFENYGLIYLNFYNYNMFIN